MALRSSSSSGIPFGGTAGRPASPGNGQPYFNGDIGRLELYTSGTGWQNIVQETPGVSSASGHYYESDGQGVFTVSGTNFVSGAIAYAVGTNGIEYQATTTNFNSLVQLTVTFSSLSAAYEPYDIKITNPSNLFGILPDAFYINESPVWGTTAGSLGSYPSGSVSIQLSSTDAESNSRTYSLVSGSLPTGLTLSSAGLISGTMSSAVNTYTFTVSVSDGINAAVSRNFSIASTGAIVSGGSLSSDSTYYYRTFIGTSNLVTVGPINADVLAIGGGGAGGVNGSGQGWGNGGGAGGAIASNSAITFSSGTYAIQVGAGGTGGTIGPGFTGTNGTDSYVSSVTYSAKGGGGGGNAGTTGATGGCGGGSGGQTRSGTNQTSPTGYTGYGYGGGIDNAYTSGGGGLGGSPADNSRQGGAGRNTWSTWLSAITSQMSSVSGWSTATSTGYIGGGGGGSINGTTDAGAGIGGGGAFVAGVGGNGTTNTGSGGGGTGGVTAGNQGSGGSGIVIIRYTKTQVPA